MRFPFFLIHLIGLVAVWWAVSQALGKQIALMTLAFLAVAPPSITYSGLSGNRESRSTVQRSASRIVRNASPALLRAGSSL